MTAAKATAVMEARKPGFKPRVGLVLGSGLDCLVGAMHDGTVIPYTDLPGFFTPTVAGHDGALWLGQLGGVAVACLAGRVHTYEGTGAGAMNGAVRALKQAGCEYLLLTNAAGSLNPDAGPGSLMLITDHINLTGTNPLTGETGDTFVDMTNAYDSGLRDGLQRAAKALGIALTEGVYIWFTGPSFETPAEIRASRTLGADLVGMSTVPEVIVARQCGLRVAAVSMITNLAAGLDINPITHEQTLNVAAGAAHDMQRLLVGFLGEFFEDAVPNHTGQEQFSRRRP